MFIVSYSDKVVLPTHAFLPGTTVNSVYYRNVLEHCLCVPHCVISDSTSCSQDLLPYMTVLAVTLSTQLGDVVQKMELEGLGTSSYSPDRGLHYYGFFQKVKEPSCCICVRMRVNILSAVEHAVTDISRKDTTDGFGQLPHV